MKKLALILAIAAIAATANANLLVNGSFETGDLTGWTTWRAPWGAGEQWNVVSTPCACDGGQLALELRGGNGSWGVLQCIDVTPGLEVTLTATIKAMNAGANWYELLLFDGCVDGAHVDGNTTDDDIIAKWDSWGGYLGNPTEQCETVSGSRTPTGNQMTVALKAGGANALGWFDCITAEQIPEPGTMMLLGMGLLGMAGLAKRR